MEHSDFNNRQNKESEINLSRQERWILRNQHTILAALVPAEAKWHEAAAEALRSGYEFEYDEICPAYEDTLSEDECRFVINSMSMYDAIQKTFTAHRADCEAAGISDHDVTFQGFDGNNETSHMAYDRFIVHEKGRFANLRTEDDFNSHSESISTYRRMLALAKPPSLKVSDLADLFAQRRARQR